jgi:hypothetical protein
MNAPQSVNNNGPLYLLMSHYTHVGNEPQNFLMIHHISYLFTANPHELPHNLMNHYITS